MEFTSTTILNGHSVQAQTALVREGVEVVYNVIDPHYNTGNNGFESESHPVLSWHVDDTHDTYTAAIGECQRGGDTLFDLSFHFPIPVTGVSLQARYGDDVIPTQLIQVSPTVYRVEGLDANNQIMLFGNNMVPFSFELQIPKDQNESFLADLVAQRSRIRVGATYAYWGDILRELVGELANRPGVPPLRHALVNPSTDFTMIW